MAYNEVTLPQWQNLVRRVFGLVGPGGNTPLLAPEIQPVVTLQPDNAEFRRLRLEKLWGGGDIVNGGAGVFPCLGLNNPAGSGTMIVFERVKFWVFDSATPTDATLRIDTQANVAAATPTLRNTTFSGPRDSREIVAGAGTPAAVLRAGTAAAPAAGFRLGFVHNQSITFQDQTNEVPQIVLLPGFGLLLVGGTAVATCVLSWSLLWYERPLEEAENRA